MHELIEHKRNTAFVLAWPAASAQFAGLDLNLNPLPTVDAWYKDGVGAWTQFVPADAIAEIGGAGATGVYAIELTAAELDHDHVMVRIFCEPQANVWPRVYQFRMHTLELDDLDKMRMLVANDRSLDVASGVWTVKDDSGAVDALTITPAEPVAGTVTRSIDDA